MVLGLYSKRKGITGIETAIILTVFVITASAFSFVILNVGFLMSDKAQTTVIMGMKENNRSFLTNVPGDFNTTTTACSLKVVSNTNPVYYIQQGFDGLPALVRRS